jgi:prepilin-type N-terminal cleavage/methylation domain-containing protein
MRRVARGFSIIEVVVALALIVILAAVALPSLAGYARQARVTASADVLATVRDALFKTGAGNHGFYQKINRNAGRLSELSQLIVEKDAGYDDSCGDVFKKAQVNDWEKQGPFVNFHIDRTAGLRTAIGNAEDTLTRVSESGNWYLRINFINNVERQDATALDAIVDFGDSSEVGNVRWTPSTGSSVVTLYYLVPVNNQC